MTQPIYNFNCPSCPKNLVSDSSQLMTFQMPVTYDALSLKYYSPVLISNRSHSLYGQVGANLDVVRVFPHINAKHRLGTNDRILVLQTVSVLSHHHYHSPEGTLVATISNSPLFFFTSQPQLHTPTVQYISACSPPQEETTNPLPCSPRRTALNSSWNFS